jgi:hypothetical protein
MSEDYNRKNDEIVARIDQKLTDFLKVYERDWQHTKAWRDAYFKRMEEMKKDIESLQRTRQNAIWPLRLGVFLVGAPMAVWVSVRMNRLYDRLLDVIAR